MQKIIRVGCRDSELAIKQTELALMGVTEHHPEITFSFVPMKTTGDKILDRNLDQIGGKGLFVKELDRALAEGRVDLTVHSLKDLPMEISEELPLIGYSRREDPRDAVLVKKGREEDFGSGCIGTSSRRRMVQLRKLYPRASFRGIRGNVQTRLRKLEEEDYSATILARAGLNRLGLEDLAIRTFSVEEMIPAAGQGILVFQGRKGEDYSYLDCVCDRDSYYAAEAERSFVTHLDGGCSSPIAAYALVEGDKITLRGLYYKEEEEDYSVGVLEGTVEEARELGIRLAEQLKNKWGKTTTGKVWLVGAGCGDLGLFTQKGMEVLLQAQVVVYDALISLELLALLPQDAELIDGGKRSNNHKIPQEEINQILLEKAKEGKRVVRLKGGDPFVFGRGGEELELLAQNEIPFEVVPGITSAVAVPAYNGIPVTHRECTSSFHVITGHRKQNGDLHINFKALAELDATLVFLMGISALDTICDGLLEAGLSPELPAAILEKGTTSRQRRVVATLGTLKREAERSHIGTPGIIVVGRVCSLEREFAWMERRPLFGVQVLVTRPKDKASLLAKKLRELGAQAIEMPSIETVPVCESDQGDVFFQSVEELVNSQGKVCIGFTSPRGVTHFFEQIRQKRIDLRRVLANPDLTFAVIGQGTGKELEGYGIFPDYMPKEYSTRELGRLLAKELDKETTLYLFRAKEGAKELLEELEGKVRVRDIPTYQTLYAINKVLQDKVKQAFLEGQIDYVTFTSASTVKGFVNALEGMDFTGIQAICIGQQTANEAARYGMQVSIAKEATMECMIEELLAQHRDND